MIVVEVLIFSIAVFTTSCRIGRSGNGDRGKLALYITLLMWASFFWGLFIMCSYR